MRNYFPWTDELADHAAALYRGGLSSSQVAAELHVLTGVHITRNSVIGRLFRMGVMGGAKRRRVRDCGPAARKSRKVLTIHTPVAQAARVRAPTINPNRPKREPVAVVESLNVPFLEIQHFQCKAVTDDTRFAQRFCGHFRAEGSVYCAAHAALYAAPSQGKAA